jgi:hypothetical protein
MLHALDGVSALLLGIGIYFRRNDIFTLALLLLIKFGMLTFVSRMITGQEFKTPLASILQTSKAFMHHLGSFIFVFEPLDLVIMTTLWRFIGMMGHALVAFRNKSLKVEEYKKQDNYQLYNTIFSILRQVALVCVLCACFYSSHIRRGFGEKNPSTHICIQYVISPSPHH